MFKKVLRSKLSVQVQMGHEGKGPEEPRCVAKRECGERKHEIVYVRGISSWSGCQSQSPSKSEPLKGPSGRTNSLRAWLLASRGTLRMSSCLARPETF